MSLVRGLHFWFLFLNYTLYAEPVCTNVPDGNLCCALSFHHGKNWGLS